MGDGPVDAPADWLIANVDLVPPARAVLDVASGRGRHALWLARRGWPVHAVDRNPQALAALADTAARDGLPITTRVVDLEAGEPATLGECVFGAVIVFNYLYRPLFPAMVHALEPGGVLIYETFTAGQAVRGHPKNPAFLLGDGELPRLVAPLAILRAREGDVDGRLVSSIVAVRR